MHKKSYLLTDSFEMEGRWWLPNCPANRVPGTLRYSPDELVLSLSGSFGEPAPAALGVLSDDFDRFSHIHGVLENGHHCTLVNAFVTRRQSNLRETTRLECSAIYLLVGHHVPHPDTLTFESMTFGCTHLDAFLNARVFQVEQHHAENVSEGLTVKYSVPPRVSIRVAAISADLAMEIPVSWSEGHTRIVLTAEPSITVKPDCPKDLDWYTKTIWRFVFLLTLATNESVRPTWLRFSSDNGETDGWVLYKAARPYQPSDASSGLLLFYFAHLHEPFASICDRWFSADEVLLDSIHLFMDAVRDHGASLQGRFLSLSQALEAFSRATTSSEYMPKADYEKVVSDVIAAIPCSVGSDHRASLKNRIKYGNEHSLRKRLTTLINSLTPDTASCVCQSPKNFVTGIVETRNYLTHYTDELRPKALRGAALLWGCERMAMLLRILLLREVGIEEAMIVTRLREHPRLMQYIHLQQKHPECVADQRPDKSSQTETGIEE